MSLMPFAAAIGRRSVASRTVSATVRAVFAPVVTPVKTRIVPFISSTTTTPVFSTATVLTVVTTAAAATTTPVSTVPAPVSAGRPSTATGGSSPAMRRPVTVAALI